MSNKMVNLDTAAEIMGHDWTVGKVIEKIIDGEMTAYVRIHCCPQNDSCDDEDEKYEIARVTKLIARPNSQTSADTEWYSVHYEPIESMPRKIERDNENYDVGLASDNYDENRIFGYLKSKSIHNNLVSTEQICLLNTDILRFLSGEKGSEKNAAQTMAMNRHNTEKCNEFADKIMEHILKEQKQAVEGHWVINHLRFTKEADVPVQWFESVKQRVLARIKDELGFCGYKALSRPPRKTLEDYFLLK